MTQAIRQKIQRAFNKSASKYDRFSSLHREIADKLLVQVTREPKPSALLDVGCGTGYLTVKLKEYFPQSEIVGLDFAQGMLDVARSKNDDIDWVLADGHQLPFAEGRFDVLISNLAYQWADDLPGVFREAKRVLAPQGVLASTLFGYNTCQELFQSLNEASSRALRFSRLPNESQVSEALRRSGFKNAKVNCEEIKIKFKDMQELTTWLKTIGANNLSHEGYLGPEAIARAANIYRDTFSYRNGVGATFEVIWIYVKK